MNRRLAALILALALGKSFDVQAQGFDFASPAGPKSSAPDIQIYADDGLEWQSDQTLVIAHGNAKAVRGDMTVTADELTAYYRNASGQTAPGVNPGANPVPPPSSPAATGPAGGSQIWRVDADGHVTLSSPNDIATGNKAVYDLDKAVLILKGQPARLNTPTESYSADDQLEYWEQERMAVLRGNAVATGKDKKIQADVLTAHFKDRKAQGAAPPKSGEAKSGAAKSGGGNGGGGLELSRADAYGHVIVTTTQDVVTGDRGDYNADTGIVTLTGNVQMTRGTNVLHGGYAHVDLNTGISTLFGNPAGDPQGKARAEGTFVPTPKDGGDQRTPLFTGKGVNKTKPSDGSEPQAMQQGTQQ